MPVWALTLLFNPFLPPRHGMRGNPPTLVQWARHGTRIGLLLCVMLWSGLGVLLGVLGLLAFNRLQ